MKELKRKIATILKIERTRLSFYDTAYENGSLTPDHKLSNGEIEEILLEGADAKLFYRIRKEKQARGKDTKERMEVFKKL